MIEDGAFVNTTVRNLSVFYNGMQKLSSAMFENVTITNAINVYFNSLDEIPFDVLENTLPPNMYMMGNNITTVPSKKFQQLYERMIENGNGEINFVDLGFNKIDYLPENAFSNLGLCPQEQSSTLENSSYFV